MWYPADIKPDRPGEYLIYENFFGEASYSVEEWNGNWPEDVEVLWWTRIPELEIYYKDRKNGSPAEEAR